MFLLACPEQTKDTWFRFAGVQLQQDADCWPCDTVLLI